MELYLQKLSGYGDPRLIILSKCSEIKLYLLWGLRKGLSMDR